MPGRKRGGCKALAPRSFNSYQTMRNLPLPQKIECSTCHKKKGPEAYSQKQLTRLQLTINRKGPDVTLSDMRCLGCIPGLQNLATCGDCHKTKPLSDFSKRQRGEGDTKKCEDCMVDLLNRAAAEVEAGGDPDDRDDDEGESDSDATAIDIQDMLTSNMTQMELSSTYTTTMDRNDDASEDGGVILPKMMNTFMGSELGTFHQGTSASRGSDYPPKLTYGSSACASPAANQENTRFKTAGRGRPQTPPRTERKSRWPRKKASPKAPIVLPKKSGPGYNSPSSKAWSGFSDSEDSESSDDSGA